MSEVVTLDQVRAHLRIPDNYTQDDDMLENIFIPAASAVVRRECGDIIPQTYEEYYDGGELSIWLRHKPILSIQLVEEGWGFADFDLELVEVNTVPGTNLFAYSIDIPNHGLISRRSGGNVNIPFMRGQSNIHVIYTVGLSEIPANIVLAALQILAFWYQGFLQRAVGTNNVAVLNEDFPRSGNDVYTPQNLGVPSWLLELLKPNRRPPVIG